MKTSRLPTSRPASSARLLLPALLLALAGLSPARGQNLVYRFDFAEASATGLVTDSIGGRELRLRGGATRRPGAGTAMARLVLPASTLAAGTAAEGGEFTSGNLIGLSRFTFTGWFQLSGSKPPAGTLLSLRDSTTNKTFLLTLAGAGGNQLRAIGQGGRNILSNPSPVISSSAGEWIFFALSVDSTLIAPGINWNDAVRFYIATAGAKDLVLLGNAGISSAETASDASLAGVALSRIDGIVLGNTHGAEPAAWRALAPAAQMADLRLYDEVLDAHVLDGIRLQSIPDPTALGL